MDGLLTIGEVARRSGVAASALRFHAARGRAALTDLSDLAPNRYPHDVLLPRVWELRDGLAAYDAVYAALAEALDAPLPSRDRRLATGPEHRARTELV